MASSVIVRKALQSDCRNLFDLANSSDVRANSITSNEIRWEDHCVWFSKKLQDTSCLFFVAEMNGEFVGTVRFDLDQSHTQNDSWIVSISISSKFRGQGLGKEILKIGLSNMSGEIVAFVKKDNHASNALFQALSFSMRKGTIINGIALNCYSLVL